MTPEAFEARLKQLLSEEASQPLGWWYLSYADETKFRGGIIIAAHGFTGAAYMANILKFSPGGQVTGVPVPPGKLPPEWYRNRLLTLEELNEIWGDMTKLSELEGEPS